MQFAFTDEQELLRREAREALGNGGWSRDDIAGAELSFLDRAVLYEEGRRANVGESLFDDSRPEDEQFATLALELLGLEAQIVEYGSYWQHQQLRSRGNTIEAGTSEILRNIIAERVLGLPRSR